MAFLSLWTGAFWGKPMWGTWWVWDARLTSELILFFLYLGFMSLQASIDDPRRADKAGAIVALIAILLGVTTAGWHGMFFAANARHAPPGKVVAAVSGVQFFLFIGSIGGPIVVALIVSATGDYRIVYCLLAVLAVWLGLRMLKLGRALKANH